MAKPQNKATPVESDELPRAELVAEREYVDPYRVAKRVGFVVVLLAGWAFILGSNRFHVTAPVVVVCLSYLAVLFTIVNLWRTGASAAAPADQDLGWGRPVGARGELEKEKRTLLKGIKEAEFDAAMGKLSAVDAESLIREYRARAIEVIKELDQMGDGSTLSPREQIEREVKARIALDASDKPSNRAKNARNANTAKAEVKAQARAAAAKPVDEDKAKPTAEADADASRAAADKVAVAEAKAAAARAAAEAAEAKAEAARAMAEAVEAKAEAAKNASDTTGEGEHA